MNKIYSLIPAILLLAFGFYFVGYKKSYDQQEAQKKEEAKKKEDEEKEKKKQAEAAAAKITKEKQEAKEREDAEKAKKKRDEMKANDDRIRQETKDELTKGEKLSKDLGELEVKLLEQRRNKERLQQDTFKAARDVELMKIERRAAELEIQRATDMVITRTEAGPWDDMPIFPTPPAQPESKNK